MNHFSKNLRYLLLRYGVKQSQVATHIGKAQTSISNWIHEISAPDLHDLSGFSDLFGISIDDLVNRDLEKSNAISSQRVAAFWKKQEEQPGKNRISRVYSSKNAEELTTQEPETGYGRVILNQVKEIQLKLDELKKTTEKMLKERKA